ncbi:MAG: SPOR domain-containing protein [Desulfuromonadaceae bacterium]|nr:SPOR domain-containing protein [Desulfuromonadaceae bacterium]MDD5104941.1 SPOR domain-containing protein [Desulfuromonadaceae bacterium]
MRIDYSDPKKSCSVPQPAHNRPRKEASSGILFAVIITGTLCLALGFGSGWLLSQRSAKKAFKAAMEQQSLENSPRHDNIQAQIPVPQPAIPQPAAAGTPATEVTLPNPVPSAGDPPLSFYKTLPSSQKSAALGSGINTKEEKPGKQPLQAAIPSNVTRPTAAASDGVGQGSPVPGIIRQPIITRPDLTGFTVQVSSFSLKSDAEMTRSKLAAKGYNAHISESNLGEKGIWYRVRVGTRLDPDAAKELAVKLGKGAIAIPDKE